jgi:AraC family ethanolamine operon transcriptional activator
MTTTPDPAVIDRLRAWPAWAAAKNLEALNSSQRGGLQTALIDEAMSLFIDGLRAAIPFGKGDAPKQARAQSLVREAEDFANAHSDQSVRMLDLCQATGVSARTLQYAFQTTLGISPMSYLRRRRLHEVRRMLKATDPATATVFAIACQAGFWHFSDFAQAYKDLFDELPSETLRDG